MSDYHYMLQNVTQFQKEEDHAMQQAVTETLERFDEALIEKLLEELPIEQRLRSLPPEERLRGLPPEDAVRTAKGVYLRPERGTNCASPRGAETAARPIGRGSGNPPSVALPTAKRFHSKAQGREAAPGLSCVTGDRTAKRCNKLWHPFRVRKEVSCIGIPGRARGPGLWGCTPTAWDSANT